MSSLKSLLSPDLLSLKARIAAIFHANPFLETDATGIALRTAQAPLDVDAALEDLVDAHILSRNGEVLSYEPGSEAYAAVEDAVSALQGTDVQAREEVRALESLSRMQDALATEREEVSAVLDMMPAGVVLVDRYGTVLKANAQVRAWLGDAVSDRDGDVCGALGLDLNALLVQPLTTELELELPLEVVARPFTVRGSDTGAVIILTDISDRRRLENEAARARETFFSMIRHELRRPLITVSRFLDTCVETTHELLHARDAAVRLTQMVDDMLLLARLERDPLAVSGSERVSVGTLAAGCVLAARERASEKGVTIDAADIDATLTVAGDAGRLQQVLGNLVDNALKFTPQGGTIALSSRREADRAIIVVEDNGPGIPESEREAVRDRFYQLRSDEARTEGLGLGLAICDRIVAAHRGALDIDQSPLGGARIRVTLPVHR